MNGMATYNLLLGASYADVFEYVVHELVVNLPIPIITEAIVSSSVSTGTQSWRYVIRLSLLGRLMMNGSTEMRPPLDWGSALYA